jgi:hypothetical protein
MSDVFDYSEATGNDRLVLLAIADEADDDGTNAYPGVATLARKVRLPERTVMRCLDRLENSGELSVVRPEKPGRGKFNRYRVCLKKDDTVSPSPKPKKGARTPRIDATTPRKGDTTQPLTRDGALYARPYTLDPSSSSSASETADSPEEEDLVPKTARLIAERRLLKRKGDPIGNPDAWLERVACQVLQRKRSGQAIRQFLSEGKTPEDVAAVLEPDQMPHLDRRPCCNTTLGSDHMFTCPEHPRNQPEVNTA